MTALVSDCMGLHAFIVLEFPLAFVWDVLVSEEGAAALSPAYWLALGKAPEDDGVVREVLEQKEKERRVNGEPETPPDLHFSLFN